MAQCVKFRALVSLSMCSLAFSVEAAGVKMLRILLAKSFPIQLKGNCLFQETDSELSFSNEVGTIMSEDRNKNPFVDVDTTFLKSKRGMLKVAEMVRMFTYHQEFEHFV